VQQFNDINELTVKPDQRAKALTRVRQTLERLEKDYSTYTAERDELKTEVARLPMNQQPPPQLLSAIDALLKRIKSGEGDLLKHVALLEKIEKEESDPKKKEWLGQLEQAKLLEKQGELGKAIAIYEKAPPEFQDAALKNQLAELKKLWEPKSPEHAKARKFIYEVWPTLDTPSLEARLKDAKEAFAQCEKVGDLLGPAKLLRGIQGHLARLTKELDRLQPEVNILDDKPTKLIQKLLPELQALDKAVNAYLEKNRPAK
jgi:chromosome segregation ATPase